MLTYLDIYKRSAPDIAEMIEEVIGPYPELQHIDIRPIPGRMIKAKVRKSLPTIPFRGANRGTVAVHGERILKIFETYIMNPRWECDQAVADSYPEGKEVLIAEEAQDILDGSHRTLATEYYYGDGVGDNMLGLFAQLPASMHVDAEGTDAGEIVTSVVMAAYGPNNVQMLMGNNSSMTMSDLRTESITTHTDEASGQPAKLTAYVQELLCFPGVKLGRDFAAARLCNLTDQSGHGLTDALLTALYGKFPSGMRPSHIYANRTSLLQLYEARKTASANPENVPFPTEWNNIPIHETAALKNDENVVDLGEEEEE
jgi:hypothetical protein